MKKFHLFCYAFCRWMEFRIEISYSFSSSYLCVSSEGNEKEREWFFIENNSTAIPQNSNSNEKLFWHFMKIGHVKIKRAQIQFSGFPLSFLHSFILQSIAFLISWIVCHSFSPSVAAHSLPFCFHCRIYHFRIQQHTVTYKYFCQNEMQINISAQANMNDQKTKQTNIKTNDSNRDVRK